MCGITSEAKSTTRMQLRALLQEQDCSIKELIEETGLSHATISRRLGLWVKSGDVVVVQKTLRNFPGWGTTVAARYAWADKSRKYHDEAEALIYRLMDRLLDTELDADGIGLIKEASRFINWDVPNAQVQRRRSTAGAQGTNTGHEDGEAMASVGVRCNAQLGAG